MDSRVHKSAFLATSAKSDVLRSGGKVSITDLFSFNIADMLAAGIQVHRAEVQQVVTIDITTITLIADTAYTILVGNVRDERESGQSALKVYRYVTPAVLGGQAVERTALVDDLAQKINDQTGNYVSAVSDGVSTVTITDDAGYYPARPSGRKGPSEVQVAQGLVDPLVTTTITTAGVVSVGDGTRLLADVPVLDAQGGLASGELDMPSGFVNGQFYSIFDVTYAKPAGHSAISGLKADKVLHQRIFVDDGAGASTANAAGHDAFLREFERLVYHPYASDPNGLVEFWEETATMFDNDGIGVPLEIDAAENIINIGQNQLRYVCIGGGTPTSPAGSDLTNGFDITRTSGGGIEADNEGIEISAEIGALSPQEYIVGQDECSFRLECSIEDVTGTDDFLVGFRAKAAYAPLVDNYTDMAAFNIISGVVNLETILNDGATTTTDTTLPDWADGETHVLEVRVALDGSVTYRYDDAEPTVVAAFTFDAGDTIIPFVHKIATADLAGNIFLKKWFSVAGILDR